MKNKKTPKTYQYVYVDTHTIPQWTFKLQALRNQPQLSQITWHNKNITKAYYVQYGQLAELPTWFNKRAQVRLAIA